MENKQLPQRYYDETVSNSGLAALSVSPRTYRNYKDKVETETSSYFNLGSAIHCKILEPQEFDNRYYVSNITAPGGMFAKFIDVLYRTRCKDGEFTGLAQNSWITNAYVEAGFKWSVQKVWEKFQEDSDLNGYYKALLKTEDKILLTRSDEKAIEACIQGIQMHEKACELVYGRILSDCRNEFEVIWKHPDFPDFKMKSIFDRLIIDEHTKVATLVDLKTTSKSVNSFKHSYKQYKYYRQMALYLLAVEWYLKDLGYDVSDWKFEVYIVATQTNGYGDTAVYTPSDTDIIRGLKESNELLTKMKWHFDNDMWDYPMEYYLNDGVIVLNLDDEE